MGVEPYKLNVWLQAFFLMASGKKGISILIALPALRSVN
jgi:hypothetical protein